MAQCL